MSAVVASGRNNVWSMNEAMFIAASCQLFGGGTFLIIVSQQHNTTYMQHKYTTALLALLFTAATLQAQVSDTLIVPTPAGENEGTIAVQSSKDSVLPLPPPPGVRAHLYRMNYWATGGFTIAATAA